MRTIEQTVIGKAVIYTISMACLAHCIHVETELLWTSSAGRGTLSERS